MRPRNRNSLMVPFRIHILGCGSAVPTKRHCPSCQLVEIGDKLLMIDCGDGSHVQMERHHLRTKRLGHIFISHLHADHCLGLTGIFSIMRHKGRTDPIHVYAQKELEPILRSNFSFFCSTACFEVIFHPIDPELNRFVYEDNSIEVATIPLHHGVPSCGFLIREKKGGKRSYAYCSDTAYNPDIPGFINGVNLLYHEATYASDKAQKAIDYGHSTAADAALTAKEAGAKRLIIGHFSSRYEDESVLLDEAKAIFPNTFLADEHQITEIE